MGINNPYNTTIVNESSSDTKNNPIIEKSIIDGLDNTRKREATLGMLAYGLQGLSALRDLNQNANQEYTEPPKPVLQQNIEYKPTDIKPYMDKIEQASAGYLKYLKETGNGSLIPSLMGMETQRNDLAAKITESNNQKEMAVDTANTQSNLQVQQLNQQLRSDYNRQRFAEMQYKDQAMNTNKQGIFGALSGILKTSAGSSSQDLKLRALKEYIKTADETKALAAISRFTQTGDFNIEEDTYDKDYVEYLKQKKQ